LSWNGRRSVRAEIGSGRLEKEVIFADTLARNTAGKLLKRELRTTYSATR
jgi:acyl-CoA synthetase (AMP-forming)/AMP-acid ligase II